MIKKYLEFSPEVIAGKNDGKPLVALESTIISHGMPYPQNLETAHQVENIIREKEAVPVTIAILEGRLKVGLTEGELESLAKAENVVKVSRRDLPHIISGKLNGATTVASTMIIAHLAGIKVFVTGGIGGVHRGADKTFDISADLLELAQTDVAVVCAGAKSILDIGATLEYLETHGVPVYGYQTTEFPAFYTRRSGFNVECSVQSTLELAKLLKVKWDLGLKGGVVVGNPVPEQYEMDYGIITKAIDSAVQEAEKKKIFGKEVTPFLLAKIAELTGEKSLAANIELVFNNARIGAELAKDLASLKL